MAVWGFLFHLTNCGAMTFEVFPFFPVKNFNFLGQKTFERSADLVQEGCLLSCFASGCHAFSGGRKGRVTGWNTATGAQSDSSADLWEMMMTISRRKHWDGR